jgi:transcription termination factor Rho
MTEEQQNPESGAQAADSAGTTETPRRRRTTRNPRIGRVRRKKSTPDSTDIPPAQDSLASPSTSVEDSPSVAEPISKPSQEAVAAPSVAETPKAQPAPQPAPVEEKPPQPPAPIVYAEGIVEVSGKGFGFLREARRNFTQSNNDIFVTPELVRKYALRDGMSDQGRDSQGKSRPSDV